MLNRFILAAILTGFIGPNSGCGQTPGDAPAQAAESQTDAAKAQPAAAQPAKTAVATFGSGCFWCTEAVFENLNGVTDVVSGYTGGRTKNPNYKQISTGRSGHAEVCQIKYDPSVVSYSELLEVFFKTHDPTTLNRQGPDTGTQYRSAIYYYDEEQKHEAELTIKKLNAAGAFNAKIVTEVTKASQFYPAEDYHQDYFRKNPNQSYCAYVVAPKVEKFKKVFADKLSDPK